MYYERRMAVKNMLCLIQILLHLLLSNCFFFYRAATLEILLRDYFNATILSEFIVEKNRNLLRKRI